MKLLMVLTVVSSLLTACAQGPFPGYRLLTPEQRSHIEVRHVNKEMTHYTVDGKTWIPLGEK